MDGVAASESKDAQPAGDTAGDTASNTAAPPAETSEDRVSWTGGAFNSLADLRNAASGIGKRLGGLIAGAGNETEADESPAAQSISEDPTAAVDTPVAAPADEAASEDSRLARARLAAGQAYSTVREASSAALHAVKEDPRAAAAAGYGKVKELGGSVKEQVKELGGTAVERVSAAASTSQTVASLAEASRSVATRTADASGYLVEKSRSVASKTAEAYHEAKPALANAAARTYLAAKTHTPAVVATAGGAIGGSLGAAGNAIGAAAGAAAGVAAATLAHTRMRRAMREAGVEGVDVIRLSEALAAHGADTATAELEIADVRSTTALRDARAALDESGRVAAEGHAVYLHSLFDEACAVPGPPSHPAPAARPAAPTLPSAAALAYAHAAEECTHHTTDVATRLAAFRKRASALRAQVSAATAHAAEGVDPDELARRKQMGVYSARALIGAACTCVSELAAGSVKALGGAGGLSLRAMVVLEADLATRYQRSKAPFGAKDAESLVLSAGGTTSALGTALLQVRARWTASLLARDPCPRTAVVAAHFCCHTRTPLARCLVPS